MFIILSHDLYKLGVSEISPPPDGYLPMKPGYTFCSYMTMEGHTTSKQGKFCFVSTYFGYI